ncbi:hypothetical protein FAI40_02730 [Acetobacteraceae bacterium]|nr:hypothetical protein FAI40_02730 [Acetobacteraceae bacterium]
MANSVPNSLEALLSRQSIDSLQAPAPQGEILEAILKSGLCAPDHGRIRPWRWVTVSGEENCTSLGKKVAEALKRQALATDEKKTVPFGEAF